MAIYLDYNATTPVDGRVAAAIRDAVEGELAAPFGNPSSLYRTAKPAKALLTAARAQVAALLGAASPEEILFESGGSESINHVFKGLAIEAWAVLNARTSADSGAAAAHSLSAAGGAADAAFSSSSTQRPHIIVSAIEHVAVLECASWLERKGFADVTRVPVGVDGVVSAADIAAAVIPGRSLLVSVMLANNETGAVQPIRDIVFAVRQCIREANAGAVAAGAASPPFMRPFVHTDASQCVGKLPFVVGQHPWLVAAATAAAATSGVDAAAVAGLGIDFLTVAGHKLYCPKGIGATYIRSRADSLAAAAAAGSGTGAGDALVPEPSIALPVFMHGAGQEGGRRAGTENLVLAAALGAAAATFTAPAAADAEGAAGDPKHRTQGDVEAAHCAELRDRLAHRLMDIWAADPSLAAAGTPIVHGPLRHCIAKARSASAAIPAAASCAEDARSTGGYTSLPNTLSIALPGCFAAEMVGLLSGTVAVSAGAACHATAPGDPRAAHVSHVLAAMSVSRSVALATLRLSVGRWSTAAEMDAAAEAIAGAARKAVASAAGAIMRELRTEEGGEHSAAGAIMRELRTEEGGEHSAAATIVAAPLQPVAASPKSAAMDRDSSAPLPRLTPTRCRFLEDTHVFAVRGASVVAVLSAGANAKGEAVPQLTLPLPSATGAAPAAADVKSSAAAHAVAEAAARVTIGPAVAAPPGAAASDTAVLVLSETVAHPQGGGQPSDRGVILFDYDAPSTAAAGAAPAGGAGAGAPPSKIAFIFHAARKADKQLARDGVAGAIRTLMHAAPAAPAAGDSGSSAAAAASIEAETEAIMTKVWPDGVGSAVGEGGAATAAASSSAPAGTDRILHYGRFYSVQAQLADGSTAAPPADTVWAATLADALPASCNVSDIAGAAARSSGGIVVPLPVAGGDISGQQLLMAPLAAAAVEATSLSLASVSVFICAPHRRMAARLHSAGHLLDLAVRRVLGRWVEADATARAALAASSSGAAAASPVESADAGGGDAASAAAASLSADVAVASPKAAGKPGKGGKGGKAAGGAGGAAALPPPLQQLVPGKGYHFVDGPFVEYQGTVSLPLQGDSSTGAAAGAGGATSADAATTRFAAEVAEACGQLLAEDAPTYVRVLRSDDVEGLASAGLAAADVAHLPPGTPVRIVAIGGSSNTCPCGGTHVKRAGEIGRGIAVTKVVSKKGVTKVSYALLD